MKIISVVGARPNFMKMAPVHKAFRKYSKNNLHSTIKHLICHTGQHYDEKMSKVFFEDLELPEPDFYLGVGSGTHAEQTAKIMIEFEKILLREKPDIIIVYGDVNSTVACALTAIKLKVKVAHVEAGLRSFDRTMPEEINRILTDQISDYLFVTEESGIENLKKEGVAENKIFFVGNTMIDSLVKYLPKTEKSGILKDLKLFNNHTNIKNNSQTDTLPYILVTLHRPSNVDNKKFMDNLVKSFNKLAKEIKIVFPVHPRTRKNLETWNIIHGSHNTVKGFSKKILITEPLPYIDFLTLMKHAKAVITDSGGIQEETTFLRIPCLTLRKNTERPVTIKMGTNQLIGRDIDKAIYKMNNITGSHKQENIPDLWDGKAANRILQVLTKKFNLN